jgi:KUP system potassium uptake protein
VASHKDLHKLSAGGLLISLGIIYGDIGTSPLYVFKAIIGEHVIGPDLIYGALSCIFWTLTLQTTIKYVIITLRADNKGEGGIFSLFSLVRRKARWLVFPAMIGGCTLLADGMITPPITVSAAIEGLSAKYSGIPTVLVVAIIITILFIIQQFGTSIVGKAFGPMMFAWFSMMAVIGFLYVIREPSVAKAVNPYYAFNLLTSNPRSLFILGAVFLCTTGAEALYSDLGHCGRSNIRISWIFVKTCLLLNYFGQGIWLLQHTGKQLLNTNPFYAMMPDWFLIFGIGIATIAAIIASQAMITGSFTLISEAVRLNLWPKVKINYPSDQKGQLYVPSINVILWVGCMIVILYFRQSSNMEGAYGLAINLTFLMTTLLVSVFLKRKKFPTYLVAAFLMLYLAIECTFMVANMAKFFHGGWFTLALAIVLFSVMWTWSAARRIKNRYVRFVEIEEYFPIIRALSEDTSVPKYSSQLVYLTSANFNSEIESKIMYSILQKQPKRADIYWLVHVDVMDEPYTREYKVEQLIPGKLIRIDFRLGFRVEQKVNLLFRKVVEELVKKGEVDITSQYDSLKKYKIVGDFRFVVLEKLLSRSNNLRFIEKATMAYYFVLKNFSLSEERSFGLDLSFVTVEQVPLIVSTTDEVEMKRVGYPAGSS